MRALIILTDHLKAELADQNEAGRPCQIRLPEAAWVVELVPVSQKHGDRRPRDGSRSDLKAVLCRGGSISLPFWCLEASGGMSRIPALVPSTERRPASYPFFFGRIVLTGVSVPRVSDEVAAAGAAGLAAFGLRVSRLLRFCPLAILSPFVCRILNFSCAETRSSTIFKIQNDTMIALVQSLHD